MTSSENVAIMEPWVFRSSFTDSWMSEAFSRDNDTLTRALQKSFCTEPEPPLIVIDSTNSTPFIKPEPTRSDSVSDPDSFPKRKTGVTNGKITKRKSRASKRSPTTFIKADPANFRQMVQQVTGIRFGDSHVPVVPVLKPEPQRPGNRMQGYSLPTLDTSAFLLDNHQLVGPSSQGHGLFAQGVEVGAGLDFESIQNFPTLESWRVM